MLTLALAGLTTIILLMVGTPVAWWLARSNWRGKEAIAAVVALPLVLPPTVLGFYLLITLGPFGPGGWLAGLWGGRTLAFSFPGLVMGSVVYSLPFMVQPLRNGFAAIAPELVEAATTLGASRWQIFWALAVPMARPAYIAGVVLSFAHTVGEFGLVLMIGGNIPGQTKVLSVAIYDSVERLEWGRAHLLSLGLVGFAFVVILVAMLADRRTAHGMPAG
ncbi:molybdate ABC transporter permease subunit [Devosia rhodophyticola]|uniref:Molybdenum transport system permease n=1 Tax=Devosia rhodophyticola TaxID=3026423 RepID=A0ABY7Z1L9_9HYPH|nr:molybdate ABC transporter permease subunit [Devosia rhodophyticola]WDR07526.1 molybdate ABC transporter permease subunit [Devosia rhodophyticola]